MLSWWNGIHSGLRSHRLKCRESSNLSESTRFNNYGGLAERSMALVLKTIGLKSSESSNLSPASKFYIVLYSFKLVSWQSGRLRLLGKLLGVKSLVGSNPTLTSKLCSLGVMANTVVLETTAVRRIGSSPIESTRFLLVILAYSVKQLTVNQKNRVRIPKSPQINAHLAQLVGCQS